MLKIIKDGAWIAATHSDHVAPILRLHEYHSLYECAKEFIELHKDDLTINYQSTFNALVEAVESIEKQDK